MILISIICIREEQFIMGERNPLTEEEFNALATDAKIYDKEGKELPRPTEFKEGLYNSPVEGAGAGGGEETSNELFIALQQVYNLESGKITKKPLSPDVLSEGLKLFCNRYNPDNAAAPAQGEVTTTNPNPPAADGDVAAAPAADSAADNPTPANLEGDQDDQGGDPANLEGDQDDQGGDPAAAAAAAAAAAKDGGRRRSRRRQPKRSAKKSQKGGRSRKNRRKQSRRRKH